jgi:hypothetical protein
MKKIIITSFLLFASGCGSAITYSGGPAPAQTGMLKILQAPTTLTADGCIGPFVLDLQDTTGAVVTALKPITINVSSAELAHLRFFSDGACSATLSSLVLAEGNSNLSFYLEDTVAEPLNLSFTSSSGTVTVNSTISAGSTSGIEVRGPQDGVLGACVGPIQIETVDLSNNLTATTGNNIMITANSGTINNAMAFSDSGCQSAITSIDTKTSEQVSFYVQVIADTGTSVNVHVQTEGSVGSYGADFDLSLAAI